MKKIIITGCTGCVGSAVVRAALSKDYNITCIVHRGSKRLGNLPRADNVRVVECDVNEYASLFLDGTHDVFMHMAWEKTFGDGRDDVDVQLKNIQYTLDAVRLAKRCGCSVFIGAGSQAEYGIKNEALTGKLPVNPESGYGIAKFSAGKLSALLCKQLGMRFNWVRILSVYGENDGENTLVSYVVRELKAGRSPELTECGQIWDYLHCDDAARAFLAVAENGADGAFYPLGGGQGRQLSEYVEDIQRAVAPDVPIQFGIKEYYPHQPMHLVADISELTKDTGWKPMVDFTDGIRKMIGNESKTGQNIHDVGGGKGRP